MGLGTAAILAAGGASAIAETPSPSDSGSAEPTPTLQVRVTVADASVEAGTPVAITTKVSTDVGKAANVEVTAVSVTTEPKADPTVTGDCPPPAEAASCTLGTVDTGGETITSVVTVPKDIKNKVTVSYKVTVVGTAPDDKTQTVDRSASVVYTPIKVSPTPTKTPTKSPTKKPTKKPTKSPSPSASSSSSSGTSSGGGSGSGGSSGSSGSGSGSGGYAGPSPNSSFDARNPQVALPPIQAPSPSVAPSPAPGSGTPQSRLQGNKAPVAQDLTFERMASTQIAWLAALLVAFSLLLTQVRLGRRRQPAGAPRRTKGTHRRPRHGMFGR
ncbi:hypothetical protein [Actinomadura welshii]|uniref:hypothetical protein n=1 Tax=Actinomadura welshii TaxID=3103817 RepID=UPI0003ACF5DB|nr:hypothetical protein [Actinomadura madurae]